MKMLGSESFGQMGACARVAFASLLSLPLLAGCEAALRLDPVKEMQQQSVRRTDRFQAAARNASALVVVGNHGIVVTSNDDGKSWKRTELNGWPTLIDVASCPSGEFVAVSYEGELWRSKDNGANWAAAALDTSERPQALTCTADNRIWVVGGFSTILSSADGGESWEVQSLDQDLILTGVQFFDASNGVLTGEFGTVVMTHDGGATWETLDPLPDEFYPQDAYFKDANTGWIVGLGGKVYHTVDGGLTWSEQASDTVAPLYGITPVGDKLYAVGSAGTMLRLDGDRWTNVPHDEPIHLYLRAALAVSDEALLVAGGAGALHVFQVSDDKAVAVAVTESEGSRR